MITKSHNLYSTRSLSTYLQTRHYTNLQYAVSGVEWRQGPSSGTQWSESKARSRNATERTSFNALTFIDNPNFINNSPSALVTIPTITCRTFDMLYYTHIKHNVLQYS